MRGEAKTSGELTIYATLNPDVSVLIAGSTVTGVEESGIWLNRIKSETAPHGTRSKTNPHVSIEVAVVIPPNGPSD